jgi:glycosyltransferase involved in cell wall biosynthesis
MDKYVKGMVSVIIPTYGRSDMLMRAINSVKSQTYANIEILVVDDNEPGSEFSQQVEQIIETLRFDNLSLVKQEKHINGAAARNAGIRASKGEFIAFLDDDDMFMPEKIQRQVKEINKLDNSYGAVSSQKIYIKNGVIDGISDLWKTTKHQNFDIITRKINVSTCTLLMRRICLDETGYFNENLRRNQEVQLLAFFTMKYKIRLVPELLTIIDCSDVANRPNAKQIVEIKQAYLDAIAPILDSYSRHKQKIIVRYTKIDVFRVYLREKEIKKALSVLVNSLLYPSVLFEIGKLACGRIIYRNTSQKLSPEIVRIVYKVMGVNVL